MSFKVALLPLRVLDINEPTKQPSSLSTMNLLLPAFKTVSLTFAIAAVVTGTQAILYPMTFLRSFGLPFTPVKEADKPTSTANLPKDDPITSYVSLMGVRQLATGMTLLTFAYQRKWTEMATMLTINGILVAGTDGFYLSRSGAGKKGLLHAIPGALIALLSAAVAIIHG